MKHEILYADDSVIVVSKPSGVTVIPGRSGAKENSLLGKLESSYNKLFVVHRIDKPTSGIVCFARNAESHRNLNIQFEKRQVNKYYLAFVKGRLKQPNGTIDLSIDEHPAKPGTMRVSSKGKEAITDFELVEQFRHAALVKFNIKTGRMHQIRVHAAAIGHPLLVDDIYGSCNAFYISDVIKNFKTSDEDKRPTISRLTLHAHQIQFKHPETDELLSVEAPLAKDMEVLLKLLRRHDK